MYSSISFVGFGAFGFSVKAVANAVIRWDKMVCPLPAQIRTLLQYEYGSQWSCGCYFYMYSYSIF